MQQKKWAFFSYAHNLGDFTRALETAKGMSNFGNDVCFFNHGGTHLPMIEQAGLQSVHLLPEISDAQNETVMAINQFRLPLGTPLPFTKAELIAQVEADLEALSMYKPDGVYCGLNISSMISVPYSKLPRVTQVPTTLCPSFYQKKLATFPNTLETTFVLRRLVPEFVKRRYINSVMLKDVIKGTAQTFNEVRKHFGLQPIYNMIDFVKGDLILLPDLPELSGLAERDLPPEYKYTGPIFSKMDHLPVPHQVSSVYKPSGINVFCALGSSGSPEVLKTIVACLRQRSDINLVCATTSILDPQELGEPNERFFATRYLPAHLVNEMADIAVTHGGQGTIQTAVWAGTPVIGIGFQSEQQQNIDGLVRAGMATRIRYYDVNRRTINAALKKVQRPDYKRSAETMQALVRQWDGVENSVRLMNDLIGN